MKKQRMIQKKHSQGNDLEPKEGHMVKGHFGIVKSKGYQERSNIYDLALGQIISPIK